MNHNGQAQIINFPTSNLWKHKLSILSKEKRPDLFKICGFVSELTEDVLETRDNQKKLKEDLMLLEAIEDKRLLNLAIEFIEEEYAKALFRSRNLELQSKPVDLTGLGSLHQANIRIA